MSSKAKRLFTGSFLGTVEFVATALVGLAMMPFIIHSLGDKLYGLWIFLGSFLGYYSLMDFGIGSAVQRYCARAITLEDYDDANSTINSAFTVFVGVGFVVLAASLLIAVFVPMVMPNLVEKQLFSQAVVILGINFALGLPLRVFSGVLTANLRYDVNTGIELVKLLVRTALIIVFLGRGYGIIALALITCVVDIVGYLAKFLFTVRLYPYVKLRMFSLDRSKVRSLVSYSYLTFVVQVTNQLRYNVDNLVIVAVVGMNFVTLYSIGARLVKYFTEFIVSSMYITTPFFSSLEANEDYEGIQSAYLFLTKISSYLSILVGSVLIIFGKAFIDRWMGKGYEQAYTIMVLLLVPSILSYMQSPSINLLYGISKHKYYAITNTIEGVSNLVLSIILAKQYGIIGVALGTTIPMMIIKIFVQPIYTCRAIKLPYRSYYIQLMLPVAALSLSILFAYWHLVRNLIAPDYLSIALLACGEAALFVIIVWFLGFNRLERGRLLSVVPSRLKAQ